MNTFHWLKRTFNIIGFMSLGMPIMLNGIELPPRNECIIVDSVIYYGSKRLAEKFHFKLWQESVRDNGRGEQY